MARSCDQTAPQCQYLASTGCSQASLRSRDTVAGIPGTAFQNTDCRSLAQQSPEMQVTKAGSGRGPRLAECDWLRAEAQDADCSPWWLPPHSRGAWTPALLLLPATWNSSMAAALTLWSEASPSPVNQGRCLRLARIPWAACHDLPCYFAVVIV